METSNAGRKKQQILIVHNHYQIQGGEDTVVLSEKKMLEKHGHKVVLYTRDNSEIRKRNIFYKLCLPFIFVFNIRTYIDIKKIIKEQNIDIVHVHNTLSLISASVYYAAQSCGIPVVQTIHNFRLLCPCATFYRNGHICEDCLKKGLFSSIQHKCYRKSRIQTSVCVVNMLIHRLTGIYKKMNCICLTEFNKQKLLQLKQLKNNYIFIKPNFVEQKQDFIPGNKRENYFLYAGRFDGLKDIDNLFKSWNLLEDNCIQSKENTPKLIICGTGPKEEWMRNYIKKHKINAEMKGFVPSSELIKFMAHSRAVIFPTKCYEGFPMIIAEAYSVGTPVICPDMGNAGIIVKEGITGCKYPVDSESGINEAIAKLEQYKHIYETTLEEYKRNYTEEINYLYLKSIYEKVK